MKLTTTYDIGQELFQFIDTKGDEHIIKFTVGEIVVEIGVSGSAFEKYYPKKMGPKDEEEVVYRLKLFATSKEAVAELEKVVTSRSTARIQNAKREWQ